MVCPYHGWAFDGEGTLQDVPVRGGGGHSQAASQPVVCAVAQLRKQPSQLYLADPAFLTAAHPPLLVFALSCRQPPTRASGPSAP